MTGCLIAVDVICNKTSPNRSSAWYGCGEASLTWKWSIFFNGFAQFENTHASQNYYTYTSIIMTRGSCTKHFTVTTKLVQTPIVCFQGVTLRHVLFLQATSHHCCYFTGLTTLHLTYHQRTMSKYECLSTLTWHGPKGWLTPAKV